MDSNRRRRRDYEGIDEAPWRSYWRDGQRAVLDTGSAIVRSLYRGGRRVYRYAQHNAQPWRSLCEYLSNKC
ncbi:hypothetical protein HW555_002441 [Spodoptera exigua]|uniref:Uncharacterized protein n=1 Tax=Spodoptera exigua TaxID=7107 RepID=A0A835GNG9_SPOEX|nr:hypothetical protein HW555_002441 [Spodoptera exigua]